MIICACAYLCSGLCSTNTDASLPTLAAHTKPSIALFCMTCSVCMPYHSPLTDLITILANNAVIALLAYSMRAGKSKGLCC